MNNETITQGWQTITAKIGSVPVIPVPRQIPESSLPEICAMAMNFMRNGCPRVQFITDNLTREGLLSVGRRLKQLALANEQIEFDESMAKDKILTATLT